MTAFKNCPDLLMSIRRPDWMGQTIEDVYRMRNVHAVADLHGSRRPNSAPFADKAPLPDRDLTAMREYE